MAETSDKFNPELCEEMTGYTFRDMIAMYEDYIAMYEDYERMASELEEIQNIGEQLKAENDHLKTQLGKAINALEYVTIKGENW